MDSPWSEPRLGDLEAATLTEQHVLCGDANAAKGKLHVTGRGVIEAQHLHGASDFYAGRVHRDEHDRVMAVAVPVLARPAEDEQHLAPWVACAGDVPLA